MEIIFDHVMPNPLSGIQHQETSIWGNYIKLEASKKIMLNAASGKGKSTFTSTVLGLRKDYAGKITYDQKDVKTITPEAWATLRSTHVSVVFQDLQLFSNLSVEENLQIKNQLSNTFSESELKNMLDFIGIADKWKQKCGILSMGQQQRVAIIRSLTQSFEWLFLDEPFSHLDKKNAQLCLQLIDERCKQLNAGFVLTTLGDDYGFNYDYTLNL